MRPVIIEKSLQNKDELFYLNEILNNNSQFIINQYTINKILLYNKTDQILILYVIYKIIINNDLVNIGISPTPRKGLSFTDSITKNSLSIYHCHLNGRKVLICYVERNKLGDLNLQIEYINHPSIIDNYKSILTHIYKYTNGYNTITNEYFKNYRNLTYLKNSFIHNFKKFLKLLR